MFVEKRFEILSLFVYYKAGSVPLYGPKMKKGVMGRGKIEQFLSKFSLSFDKIAIFLVLFFGEMSFGISGGFRGGGADAHPQGFDPLPTQRVPLWYSLRNPFLADRPSNFLKAPLAPMYTNFEGGARAEKNAIFWSKLSKKCLKRLFLDFFQNFACGAENLANTGTKLRLGESSKNQLGQRSTKFLKIF